MVITKREILTVCCSLALVGSLMAGCSSSPAADKERALSWMRYEHSSQAIEVNSEVVQEIQKRKM